MKLNTEKRGIILMNMQISMSFERWESLKSLATGSRVQNQFVRHGNNFGKTIYYTINMRFEISIGIIFRKFISQISDKSIDEHIAYVLF